MTSNRFPPVEIDLPSKGFFYAEDNPLHSGKISIFLMSATSEDILTNRSYIERRIVLDKFLESLIATPGIKYDTLLVGDKDALMVAARISGYGKMYPVEIACSGCETVNEIEINLELLESKEVEFPADKKGKNSFTFVLPKSGATVNFRLLTHEDEKNIKQTLDGYTKSATQVVPQITTMMKRSILSINGNIDKKFISDFVNDMLVVDSRAFRKYASTVNPGLDWNFAFTCKNCGKTDRLEVPVTERFFWPE